MGSFGRSAYYFEQLREFVPRDSLQVLEQQKERVSRAIDEEVDRFAKDLFGAIEKAVQQERDALTAELDAMRGDVKKVIERAKAAKMPTEAIDELHGLIDAYDAKWRGLGKKLADVARGLASKATGLPLN